MAAITTASPDRVRAVERSAFAGVLTREATIFKRFWRSSAFGSIVEPTINLLAFGFGFGALVSTVAGIPYIQFIGTGMVALSVLFSSVFSGMYDTYVKRLYQRTYDGILATPVDVHELFLAEATWIAVRSGVFGCAPLLIAMAFGLGARFVEGAGEALDLAIDRVARYEPARDAESLVVEHERFADGDARRNRDALQLLHPIPSQSTAGEKLAGLRALARPRFGARQAAEVANRRSGRGS